MVQDDNQAKSVECPTHQQPRKCLFIFFRIMAGLFSRKFYLTDKNIQPGPSPFRRHIASVIASPN